MASVYDIKLWDKPIGTAEVTREGLYYRFRCRCKLEMDAVCKVSVGEISLGVLVPEGDSFVLNTRLPAKRFAEQPMDFQIVSERPVVQGRFIPIKPEEPFAYIERLKDAYLAQRDGQIGVIIKEKAGT